MQPEIVAVLVIVLVFVVVTVLKERVRYTMVGHGVPGRGESRQAQKKRREVHCKKKS